MPNYRSHEEQDTTWYKRAFTPGMSANFWFDDVMKNVGFSIGSMAAAKGVTTLVGKGLRLAERKAYREAFETLGKTLMQPNTGKQATQLLDEIAQAGVLPTAKRAALNKLKQHKVASKLNEFRLLRVVADYKESVYPDKKLFIPKKDSVQSAIFVGRRLFDLYHPDFHKVSVLNTVLGGYFGSRLMSNIREDKGYTYGINSVLRRMSKGVLSIIATQAAVQYVQPLLVELYKEMDRLCNELIPEEELKMVKNYMLGDILRSADGSFSVVDAYIGVTLEKLDLPDFFHEKTCTIQSVTPKDLLEMAQKYFDKNDYFEVVAGGN